ncbi:MAG: hypothetical protein KKD05_10815 [Candidatus Omnitrophica bacterium]|nr:hypothetical protein [Candidatus Omnitrophota bacterium]
MQKNNKNKVIKKSNLLEKKVIDVHYLKTLAYRSYQVDGIFGGITPKGKLYCELFIERSVTPKKTTHEILPDSRIGKEISREGKEGLIREIECGMTFDIETAKAIKTWLEKKIKDYDEIFLPLSLKKEKK